MSRAVWIRTHAARAVPRAQRSSSLCPGALVEGNAAMSKTLQDMVPKVVVHFMVNAVKSGLQKRLVELLYKEDLFSSLTKEHSDVASKRERCQKTLKFLHIAAHTLDSIPRALDQSTAGGTSGPALPVTSYHRRRCGSPLPPTFP